MEQRSLESFDGTRIVYWVGGRGERWLVIANGYGGTLCAFSDLLELLAPRYRLLIWDYRGLHRSGRPADLDRLAISDHCADLWRLLEAEGVERCALAGWSVGVQVVLEAYHLRPQLVEALLLLNGAPGRVLSQALDGKLPLLPALCTALRPVAGPLYAPLRRPLSRVLGSALALWLASRLGVVTGSPASFAESMRAFFALDAEIYLRLVLFAQAHDAAPLLPEVRVPTLVTAGDRDLITPPAVARATAARLPDARYFEFPGGTHYTVMEFPRLLANRIDSFLDEVLAGSGSRESVGD